MLTRPQSNSLPLPLILFWLVRLPLLLALPFDGLRGYGDLLHFYNLADIPGLPYLHYWIEFPPIFSFINEGIYALAGGVEHAHAYLLVLLLFAADSGNVLLFLRLERLIDPQAEPPAWRGLVYAAILGGLAYTWWYFDSLAIFFALLALYLALSRRSSLWAGVAVGLGMLTKLFPALLLPALVRPLPLRKALSTMLAAVLVFAAPITLLYAVSPTYTRATIQAHFSRGSLETVWAILDGNYRTGGLGPLVERLDPAMASVSTRNPPVVNPYLVLAVCMAIGLFFFIKSRLTTPHRVTAFYGLTMVLYFLYSPTWSPQWIQHLLPAALLVLPFSPGLLLVALLVLANLIEWPLLLSRGLFSTLPVTILLRLFLMLLLGFLFWKETTVEPVEPMQPESQVHV